MSETVQPVSVAEERPSRAFLDRLWRGVVGVDVAWRSLWQAVDDIEQRNGLSDDERAGLASVRDAGRRIMVWHADAWDEVSERWEDARSPNPREDNAIWYWFRLEPGNRLEGCRPWGSDFLQELADCVPDLKEARRHLDIARSDLAALVRKEKLGTRRPYAAVLIGASRLSAVAAGEVQWLEQATAELVLQRTAQNLQAPTENARRVALFRARRRQGFEHRVSIDVHSCWLAVLIGRGFLLPGQQDDKAAVEAAVQRFLDEVMTENDLGGGQWATIVELMHEAAERIRQSKSEGDEHE